MQTRARALACELNYDFLRSVADRVGGSFYVFDEARFERNFSRLRTSIRNSYARSEVAYALKANYMPAIGRILARLDGMAEVVSRFEYEVAVRELPGSRIVFNGPVKRIDDLRSALSAGSMVNVDSFGEIRDIETIAGEFPRIAIGMRVKPSTAQFSRFGFDAVNGELDAALRAVSRIPNVYVRGLHCHVSSRDRTVESFVVRIRELARLSRRVPQTHTFDTINIGGGFFGEMPEYLKRQLDKAVPTLEEYGEAIGQEFAALFPAQSLLLVVEPGVSLVADTLCLVAEVVEVRKRPDGTRQALLDTSINSVNPTRSKLEAPLRVVTSRGSGDATENAYRLVGHTCMEHDVIAENFRGNMAEGDFVVIENRGAYSVNSTPPFISPAPAIVDMHGGILKAADDCASVLTTYR